jgi:hypothetical protein
MQTRNAYGHSQVRTQYLLHVVELTGCAIGKDPEGLVRHLRLHTSILLPPLHVHHVHIRLLHS